MELDPAADVDWVLGFVASLDVFSAAQEQLGIAPYFGRHLVLRGMFSAAETDAIDRALNLLSESERTSLARERRLHKETAVLLHEWAHTLGAFHERSPRWLMSPIYDTSQSAFSAESARIVGLGLEFRGAPTSKEAWGKAYRAELERSAAVAWDEQTRVEMRTLADRFFAGRGAGVPVIVSSEDARRFNEALALQKKGENVRAAAVLAPLVEKYPKSDEVQAAACGLAEANGAQPAQLLAVCRPAAELSGAQPQLLLFVARIEIAGAGRSEALPLLLRAEEKLSADAAAWLLLSQLDFEAGFWSGAERAAARARGQNGASQVAAECARMRSFIGFPGNPLPPEREVEYVRAALAAHDDIDQRRYDRAIASGQKMAAAFPGAPAAAVIECRARSRGRALALTQSACSAAARAAPAAFYPQYILGLVASAEARWKDARAAMRRALEIDGGTPQVWASLAAVVERLGDAAALRDLRARYAARFGAPLRPALWPAGWTAR